MRLERTLYFILSSNYAFLYCLLFYLFNFNYLRGLGGEVFVYFYFFSCCLISFVSFSLLFELVGRLILCMEVMMDNIMKCVQMLTVLLLQFYLVIGYAVRLV